MIRCYAVTIQKRMALERIEAVEEEEVLVEWKVTTLCYSAIMLTRMALGRSEAVDEEEQEQEEEEEDRYAAKARNEELNLSIGEEENYPSRFRGQKRKRLISIECNASR